MLNLSPEVQAALRDQQAVVALESTIISHGLPYPANVECALDLEGRVRAKGATPATIGLVDGEICVGLSKSQIEELGDPNSQVTKVSRRDMAFVLANKTLGATTVAGTMIAAHMAGIKVFATGGIGGVHRGAEHDFDISADLTELGRTPVAVICAGAKSILDLPKTLEVLETNGVPILGYQTQEFPAFFTRQSGLTLHQSLDTADQVANVLKHHFNLTGATGCLVANPIPENAALNATEEAKWIESATLEAQKRGIKGKDITPFLLSKIRDLSNGASLEANLLLIRNNVELASRIACKLR